MQTLPGFSMWTGKRVVVQLQDATRVVGVLGGVDERGIWLDLDSLWPDARARWIWFGFPYVISVARLAREPILETPTDPGRAGGGVEQ